MMTSAQVVETSLPPTTIIFRTTLTRTITLHDRLFLTSRANLYDVTTEYIGHPPQEPLWGQGSTNNSRPTLGPKVAKTLGDLNMAT